MKRILDLILIALFLGALALGGYELGRRVDKTSNDAAAQEAELNQKSTTSGRHGPSGRTVYFVVGGLAIGVGAIMIGSLVGGMAKSRRRERWRAT